VHLPLIEAALRRLCLSVLFVTLLTPAAAALAVTVTITGSESPGTVALVARRVDGDARVIRADLPLGVASAVTVGDGTWELLPADDRFWAAPVYASQEQAVTLRLWPRGTIGGKIRKALPAAGSLVVSFNPSDPTKAVPAGESVCSVLGLAWSCPVPADVLDLRFSVRGFATEFRWGVDIPAAEAVDLGALDLTPGSSLTGEVRVGRDSDRLDSTTEQDVLKATEVSLTPVNGSESGSAGRRYTAGVGARGFFQVRGVPPGEYVVRARAARRISDRRTVQIVGGANAVLKEPLVVRRPRRIVVTIVPSLDPAKQRWQVELTAAQVGTNRFDVVDHSFVPADGIWSKNELPPGAYELTVQQQDGSVWKRLPVIVPPGDDVELGVLLTTQNVSGTIKLGDRPIAAKLRFGGSMAPAIVADSDGVFSGIVPELTSSADVAVVVRSESPDILRTIEADGTRRENGDLVFDLRLPATVIMGKAINEDGSPEKFALITLQSGDGRVFEQAISKEDGSFQLEGFEPGTYTLYGEGFQKSSSLVEVEARADVSEVSPVEIVLHEKLLVRGEVRAQGGRVAGTDVYALPLNVRTPFVPQATSDANGRFTLQLPPGTEVYDVLAVPRGFAMTSGRVRREARKVLTVDLDQRGGTLAIDAPVDASLLLIHDGAELLVDFMVGVAGAARTTVGGRQRVTIPNLESGPYAVCNRGKCASAYVPPFATATISVAE
jgi:hypothetical protein